MPPLAAAPVPTSAGEASAASATSLASAAISTESFFLAALLKALAFRMFPAFLIIAVMLGNTPLD